MEGVGLCPAETEAQAEVAMFGCLLLTPLRPSDTRVRNCFCVNRCGPSRRRAWNASAALKISIVSQKTFSTLPAREWTFHIIKVRIPSLSCLARHLDRAQALLSPQDNRKGRRGSRFQLKYRKQPHAK
jgi:hypothetical protein